MATQLIKLFIILICYSFLQSVFAQKSDYRLPKHVIPKKYKVELETKLPQFFKFEGIVTIEIEVLQNVHSIILNSYKLDFSANNVTLTSINGLSVQIASVTLNDTDQYVEIGLKQCLEAGNYTLEIKGFKSELRDDMSGFYKSSYKGPNGEDRWLATTQFQATHARSAFPCFDEPAMKAQFQINLIHHKSLIAVSNMPVREQSKIDNDRIRTEFEKSVTMSSYLVAFVISDFEFLNKTDGNKNYKVYTIPSSVNQAQYALEMTPKVLQELEKLTNISYALTKLDQAAIPDFAAGAMENWGLVTYREMFLLYNKNESTTKSKEEILTIIAHELTHQWFGNLVTCNWWEHTWLNEGFARYLQNYIPHLIEPKWRLLDRFVVDITQAVLLKDALHTTRPMSHAVETPSEISAVFDYISYEKASSVIHMMAHAFDMEAFLRGLRRYLKENSYNSTVPEVLFDALAKEHNGTTDIPEETTLQKIFLSWSTQPGFPLVTVTRNYTTGSMTLTQERYFNGEHSDKTAWWIPINYVTSETINLIDTKPTHWMNKNQEPLVIDTKNKDGWVIVNNQNSGYYRVNYDEENWKRLAKLLKGSEFEKINVLNRAQIVDDSLNLAKNGRISYDLALDILDYLHQETDYVVWRAAEEDLTFLDNMLSGTKVYNKYKNFVIHLVNKVYEKVGFEEKESDEHMDVFSRINALTWACKMDHPDCLNKSHNHLLAHMDKPELKIPPNLHNVVYCTGLKHGDKKEWDFLWQKYLKSHLSSEATILLNALGCSKNPEILRDYLEKTVEKDSKIRDQDKFRAVHSVIRQGNEGVMIALEFMENRLPDMIKQYTSLNALKKVFETIGAAVSNDAQYKKLQLIFEKYENEFSDSLKQGAETAKDAMDDNKAWRSKNLAKVTEWFEKQPNVYPNSASTTKSVLIFFILVLNIVFLI